MKAPCRLLWAVVLILVIPMVSGCTANPAQDSQGVPMPNAGPRGPVSAHEARLYLFNISRWDRVPTNLLILDNGRTLVNLPWNSYNVVTVRPGMNVLHFSGNDTPKLFLDAKGGATYYVVAGYNPRDMWPRHTWNFPVGDKLFILKRIPQVDTYPLEGSLIPR